MASLLQLLQQHVEHAAGLVELEAETLRQGGAHAPPTPPAPARADRDPPSAPR